MPGIRSAEHSDDEHGIYQTGPGSGGLHVFKTPPGSYVAIGAVALLLAGFIVSLVVVSSREAGLLWLAILPICVMSAMLTYLVRYTLLFPFRIRLCTPFLELTSLVRRRRYDWTSISSIRISAAAAGSSCPTRHEIVVYTKTARVKLFDSMYGDDGAALGAAFVEHCGRLGISVLTDAEHEASGRMAHGPPRSRPRQLIAIHLAILALVVALTALCVRIYDFWLIQVIACTCALIAAVIISHSLLSSITARRPRSPSI